jgi:hypothetical protein
MRGIRWMCAAALVVAGAACGESAGAAFDDLVGTWDATTFQVTQVASPGTTVELIASGATFTITLRADSSYLAILTEPETSPDTTTGTWGSSIDLLTLRETGIPGERQFAYVLSGRTVTLTGASVDFDFGNGDEPATLDVTLVKR